MLGLGSYGSSSEDEDRPSKSIPSKLAAAGPSRKETQRDSNASPAKPLEKGALSDQTPQSPGNQPEAPPNRNPPQTEPIVGPLPPVEYDSTAVEEAKSSQVRSSSPFTSTQAIIRDMTLPPYPNLDIPPSPPGSPDPESNKKFAHFLDLKKNGIHFNEKLSSSSSLKNPSLLRTLMEHAGIDEKTQYSTTLPDELWEISALPSWGFKEELLKSQEETRRKIEAKKAPGQRDAIEFVTSSGELNRSGTPIGGKAKPSAAERVMAGLGREDSKSPHKPDQSRRGDYDRRPRRTDLEHRRRSRSPTGRRRRSRSR